MRGKTRSKLQTAGNLRWMLCDPLVIANRKLSLLGKRSLYKWVGGLRSCKSIWQLQKPHSVFIYMFVPIASGSLQCCYPVYQEENWVLTSGAVSGFWPQCMVNLKMNYHAWEWETRSSVLDFYSPDIVYCFQDGGLSVSSIISHSALSHRMGLAQATFAIVL